MQSRRARRRMMAEINVVPYIDVMLVLLVIFMVTAPLINPGQVELPQMGQSLTPPVKPMEVQVRADGALLLADREQGGPEVQLSREELAKAIKRKQVENPEQPVVIAADKSVRYEEVIKVMDILQREQVKKVGLLAKPL